MRGERPFLFTNLKESKGVFSSSTPAEWARTPALVVADRLPESWRRAGMQTGRAADTVRLARTRSRRLCDGEPQAILHWRPRRPKMLSSKRQITLVRQGTQLGSRH
jgi:hypothetical protein